MKSCSHPKHVFWQRGITLIEAVATSVLVGIIAVVGANFVSDSMLLSKRATAQNYNSSAARYALDRMAREIREISITGGRQISVMTTRRLVFVSASNQAIGTKETEFSYDPITKTLSMRQGSASAPLTPLIGNVSNFSFFYYDRLGIATTSASTTRVVGILLETRDADSPAITNNSRIFLRN